MEQRGQSGHLGHVHFPGVPFGHIQRGAAQGTLGSSISTFPFAAAPAASPVGGAATSAGGCHVSRGPAPGGWGSQLFLGNPRIQRREQPTSNQLPARSLYRQKVHGRIGASQSVSHSKGQRWCTRAQLKLGVPEHSSHLVHQSRGPSWCTRERPPAHLCRGLCCCPIGLGRHRRPLGLPRSPAAVLSGEAPSGCAAALPLRSRWPWLAPEAGRRKQVAAGTMGGSDCGEAPV